MACVILINPVNDFASFKIFEVLSLGYLASYLEQEGFSVHVYDCNFEDSRPNAVAKYCHALDPLAVGFTSMVGTLCNVFKTAEEVRRILPDVPIICGGYSATFEYDLIMSECPSIDFVLRGEGELSFLKWLKEISSERNNGCTYDTIHGLVYRTQDKIQVVQGSKLVKDLDELPFPQRSKYLDKIGLASILSSRGCSARCTFCSIQEFYRIDSAGAIRCRTPRNVVDEIEYIYKKWGITRFLFIDDNFFMSERFMPGRLKNIAQQLLERKIDNIQFEVSSRAVDLRLPELDELVKAGLDLVYVGLESGSSKQLIRYRKGAGIDKNIWAIHEIRARGIQLDFGFIPFDPYIEPEDIINNLNFLLEQNLITPQTLNTLTVTTNLFPGTPLHERAKSDGLLHQTGDYYYWFEFRNKEKSLIFEDIIDYFKTRYIINVVDKYSNGLRRQGYEGHDLNRITWWLRRLYYLWVERVKALLAEKGTDHIDCQIEKIENFIVNILTAYIITDRCRLSRKELCFAQELGIERIKSEAIELTRAMYQENPPEKWIDSFIVEYYYRESRSKFLERDPIFKQEVLLQKEKVMRLSIPKGVVGTMIIDIFVPPEIDVKPSRLFRPDLPPSTLYLGSVTGMPFIQCQSLNFSDNVVQTYKIHKGWNEILLMKSGEIKEIQFISKIHLFLPVKLSCWRVLFNSDFYNASHK